LVVAATWAGEKKGLAGVDCKEKESGREIFCGLNLLPVFYKTLAQAKTNTIKIKATLGVILFNLENK
jgi:hypothetical protein